MPEVKGEKPIKGKTVFAIAKEINRQSSEILDYLKRIGVDVTGIMSKVDDTVYRKIMGHFKSDFEEAEKHKQKLIEFKKRHTTIEISEIEEELRKEFERKKKEEEERKKRLEQEALLKKEREEQARKELEEKKKLIEKRKKELEQEEEAMLAEREEREKKTIDRKKLKSKTDVVEPVEEKTKEIKLPAIEDQKVTAKPQPVQPAFINPLEVHKQEEHVFKKVGKIELSELERRTELKERKLEERKKLSRKARKEKQAKKAKAEQKETEPKTKRETKFEKVVIREDYKKPKSKNRQVFRKPPKPSEKKPKETPIEKKETIPEITDEDKRRDLDKKNKSRKQKYTDGSDVKRKQRKFDENELSVEIEEAIRETMAKMDDAGTPSSRAQLRKKKKKERIELEQKQQEEILARKNIIQVTEFLTTGEIAALMGIDVSQVIQKCFELGMMVTINQRLDKDLIVLLADEFGYTIEFQKELESDILADEEDPEQSLVHRPPVVTVMGHVDHGKTSLLDYIRKTNVVAGEAGGITQHIGAYQVLLENGKLITFLDTPGHEAFTAMRARGAQITDIVVLVVAADDSVMPQTVEAINHALAANVPIIVAINKIDKPAADPNKIKVQLSERGILIEEWGGKHQCVEISAKTGANVNQLLDKILLEAEVLDLKANPSRNARGVVVEAKLDRGKGIIATVLVQKGTLKTGDPFIGGVYHGKVKAMFDERGNRTEIAKPSTPVQLLGFDGMPQAGDKFIVLNSEKDAKEIANKRQQLKREQHFRQVKFTTLDDISKQIKEGKQVDLNVIIKGDVDGSVEALSDSLLKLGSKEVRISVIHKGIGEISENDVLLAAASSAIIIGFNVRPNLNARKTAERESVDIRQHSIIYDVINEMKLALEGLLEPDKKEEILAAAEVRQIFKVPKVGMVAGCYVLDGKIQRNNKVRLLRDGFVVYDGSIFALKRFKDDVREVESGFECGISLENFNDIKVGDVIESYSIVEIKRKLE